MSVIVQTFGWFVYIRLLALRTGEKVRNGINHWMGVVCINLDDPKQDKRMR